MTSTSAIEVDTAQKSEARPVILVVEDDEPMRNMIAEVLEPLGANVLLSRSAQHAKDILGSQEVGVVLTDLRMPYADGIEILNFAKQCNLMTQVVLITGHATIESTIDAFKCGAYDYLRKPFEPAELRLTIEKVLEFFLLNRENLCLRESSQTGIVDDLIGKSQAINSVRDMVGIAAGYDCCVLITGESGTGKEIVSRSIHEESSRKGKPFVVINCAAIPENLIESELFGYQRGAFTGADQTKVGLFEAANGGTLFLDEINNSSLALQAKLLRVLQDGTFYRMGDPKPRHIDVRLVVATNKPLNDLVESGFFRMDLYYRLKIIEIKIPPLRDRISDIPLLVNYFIERQSARLKKKIKGISTKALDALVHHNWPGNVRELENVIQCMIIFTQTEIVDVDVVPHELCGIKEGRVKLNENYPTQSLEELEISHISKILHENNGNRSVTAEILGIDKTTLWRKIKLYNIE